MPVCQQSNKDSKPIEAFALIYDDKAGYLAIDRADSSEIIKEFYGVL